MDKKKLKKLEKLIDERDKLDKECLKLFNKYLKMKTGPAKFTVEEEHDILEERVFDLNDKIYELLHLDGDGGGG